MSEASDREQLKRLQVRLTRQLVLGDREVVSPGSNTESSADSLRLPFDQGALKRAAECLIRKRLSQTAHLLRKSRRLLGKTYEAEFRRFAFEHHLSGHQAIARDAIAFARWAGYRCQRGELTVQGGVPALLDALRLEGCECEWGISTAYLRVVRLQYDIPGWNGSGVGSAIVKRQRWILLWRLAGRGHILVR